jgi:putative (di)nucleoside polyphosphate hydrolase
MTFRPNVAALIRHKNKFVACCRTDFTTWQCVQGGIEDIDLSPTHAIERELHEELGIDKKHYEIIYQSKFWRRYYFTQEILAKQRFKDNIGQEQLWFLIELQDLKNIRLENSTGEFSRIELVELHELLNSYSKWKKPPFYDFCRELNLL